MTRKRKAKEIIKSLRMFRYEKELWADGLSLVAGIDEAGRGPLAGPVIAAAVVFPCDISLPDVDDSKKLSFCKREKVYTDICKEAKAVGVGIVEENIIDKINILEATLLAMRKAVADLRIVPECLLVDGITVIPGLKIPQLPIVKGDSLSISVAAASIIAKVTRDRIMIEEDTHFPQYGFAQHKGYGTRSHLQALDKYGVCPLHRRSFAPVRKRLKK